MFAFTVFTSLQTRIRTHAHTYLSSVARAASVCTTWRDAAAVQPHYYDMHRFQPLATVQVPTSVHCLFHPYHRLMYLVFIVVSYRLDLPINFEVCIQ